MKTFDGNLIFSSTSIIDLLTTYHTFTAPSDTTSTSYITFQRTRANIQSAYYREIFFSIIGVQETIIIPVCSWTPPQSPDRLPAHRESYCARAHQQHPAVWQPDLTGLWKWHHTRVQWAINHAAEMETIHPRAATDSDQDSHHVCD